MPTIFWDVGTQHDFMRQGGRLYVPGAEAIIPNLRRLTEYAHGLGVRIVASAVDHVAGHRELSDTPDWRETFPPHCIRGTAGQRKIPETALQDPLVIEPERQDPAQLVARVRSHPGDILLHKHWFDVFTNENTDAVIGALEPRTIVLYGVATDVCDKYTVEVMLARHPAIRLFVVADATKPIDAAAQEHLLKQWGEAGVRIIETDELVEDGVPA